MNQENNPFIYLKSINNKVYITSDDYKDYNPYLTNNGLSLFPDTIMYANKMNKYNFLNKKMQYDYLFYSIRKKNRFTSWPKKKDDEFIEIVQEYFNFNYTKAIAALKLLSHEQLLEIKRKLNKGGKK